MIFFKLLSISIALLFCAFNALASDDIFFDEVVASDISGELSDATDSLIAPAIILGKKSGDISVNVRMDMSIASIDKQEFLLKTKQYLTQPIFNKINALEGDFALIKELPTGIEILLDEELNITITLTPEVMKNIDPKILNNSPKIREPLKQPVKSIINDISIKLDKQKDLTTSIGVRTALRYNRFLFTGISSYANQEVNIFKESALLNYEATDKNYLIGYFTPPRFANVSGEKTLGFSVGNTKLSNYIILESDRKYLDLTYPSTVKVYISDVLYSDKQFSAGRHILDIPLNIEPSLIKVQIEDIYGRSKDIAFKFAGDSSNHIPKLGQYLYFASLGQNLKKQTHAYLGVEFALNKLSKLALSANVYETYQLLGVNYYKVFEAFNMDNTLELSHQNDIGVNISSSVFVKKINTSFTINWREKFVNLGALQENTLEILANKKFIINDKLTMKANTTFDILNKQNNYGLFMEYKISHNLNTSVSYENNGLLRCSLIWDMGANTQFKSTLDKNSQNIGVKHFFNDDREIEYQHNNTNDSFALYDNSSIFNSFVKLHKYNLGDNRVELKTNFAIVATDSEFGLSQTIGNSGFIIFKPGSGLNDAIIANIGDSECNIQKGDNCIVKTPSNKDIIPSYELGNIDFNKVITGIDNEIYVPSRGGVVHIIDSHNTYFAQAQLMDNDKPIELMIGKIIDEQGNKIDIFTDELGILFAQLKSGNYTIVINDYLPKSIDIQPLDTEEIDLGIINMERQE